MTDDPGIPVKYTPVTGRISRVKRDIPAHICDTCRPAKTFTRAEHLKYVLYYNWGVKY